jgi:hypothetical protein
VVGEQARLHNFRITSLVHRPSLGLDGAHNLLIGKPLVYKLVDQLSLVIFEFTHQIQHMRGKRILDLDLRRFHKHEPFIAPFQRGINPEQKHNHQHNAKQINRAQTQQLDLKRFQYRIRQIRVCNLPNRLQQFFQHIAQVFRNICTHHSKLCPQIIIIKIRQR